jgi:hypothetical protein
MVTWAGSCSIGAIVGTGAGTAMARGSGAVGRSIGDVDGSVFAALGVFSGAGVSFFFAAPALAVPLFFDGVSFFAVDFFLLDLALAVGVVDFFGLGEADASGVSVGFDVASSLSDFFIDFAFDGVGDFFGVGEAPGSGVSLDFGFVFGFGEGEGVAFFFPLAVTDGVGVVLLLAFFGVGDGSDSVGVWSGSG